jgi:hypothetical protein
MILIPCLHPPLVTLFNVCIAALKSQAPAHQWHPFVALLRKVNGVRLLPLRLYLSGTLAV